MPKWAHHREVARRLGLSLPEHVMDEVDLAMDGMVEGFQHDFWRDDLGKLKEFLSGLKDKRGGEAVRYALLHILLDEAEVHVSSELGRDRRRLRPPPLVCAMWGVQTAMGLLEYLRERIGFAEDVECLLSRVDAKWLAEYLMSIGEVKSRVKAMDRFKARTKLFRRLALKYIHRHNLHSIFIATLITLMHELCSYKGGSREEHARSVLRKYEEMCGRGLAVEAANRLRAALKEVVEDWLAGRFPCPEASTVN